MHMSEDLTWTLRSGLVKKDPQQLLQLHHRVTSTVIGHAQNSTALFVEHLHQQSTGGHTPPTPKRGLLRVYDEETTSYWETYCAHLQEERISQKFF